MPERLLVIEDNAALCDYYTDVLTEAGYSLQIARCAADGITLFKRDRPQVILLDLMLPDQDGYEVMRECLRVDPAARFVVLTAYGTIESAVEVMRCGAFEFLPKPFGEAQFLAAIDRAVRADVAGTTVAGRGPSDSDVSTRRMMHESLIGSSATMRGIHHALRDAAQADHPVMLLGERGTGKAASARFIHLSSDRRSGAFVAMHGVPHASPAEDVAAIGDVGAPAGPLWARARGGTFYIADISELSMHAQAALVHRIAHSSSDPLAPRLIASSVADIHAELRQGHLRQDLWKLFQARAIDIPPLRHRGNDAVEIANDTLQRIGHHADRPLVGLAPDVEALFRTHPWPGNVRQLLNLLNGIVTLHSGPQVTRAMVPVQVFDDAAQGNLVQDPSEQTLADLVGRPLHEIEQLVIERTIRAAGGSVPKAARLLGVSPSTLYRKREGWARDGRQDDPAR